MNHRNLRVETLEDRVLLAVTAGGIGPCAARPAATESVQWWVETAEDTDGGSALSLRDALARAVSGDTVKFMDRLSGTTIRLSGRQLTVPAGVTIDASDLSGGITIDANRQSRVFLINGGTETHPAVLKGLTITGGENYGEGGGIYVTGTAELINCTVTGNTNTYISEDQGYGGGIYCYQGSLTLTGCVITDNAVSYNGGGVCNHGGTLSLAGCTVSGNSARYGAGVYNCGEMSMVNCLVTGNFANNYGGGVYSLLDEALIVSCTIADNTAFSSGGGIYQASSKSLTIRNSIVVNNSIDKIRGKVNGVNVISNYIGWDFETDCIDYRSGQPLFTDSRAGDYTLTENSIAVDAGNNAYVLTDEDLAGSPRIIGRAVDIGAYEYMNTAPAILTGEEGVYVSYGANRHRITWTETKNASGYELAYSADGGKNWVSVETAETGAVVTDLTYGTEVVYRVRALGEGRYVNSGWSAEKSFWVCPMDINGNGDVDPGDRVLLAACWLSSVGEDGYIPAADINGDGDIGPGDRAMLIANWLLDSDDPDLVYPQI
ncbi:MAG: hypothetical protein IJG60_00305 [Thermoguttaceae bacterium]|nr:hypothetical protein [Thermoguttaceae bacterium]